MNENRNPRDFRAAIILCAFTLFAFVILIQLLAPGAVPLLPTLPALLELLRISLKAPVGS
ncbi:hypothetical protein K2Z83_16945 [Oscillochloris sp. ZM17-4]|uniref:hypothetical protein n=1 Tax=Oscillochloris sp. ZM17-4 TaxID=2866714 RepID=UPI001C73D7BC|nr:hypothetical protein [Oscillochloris sp. ZM17-4]MBX0329360.1 hypothetical protein [Oscillochloris sp. ZM17-4]